MAETDSNLYKVLTNLNLTDRKLAGKLSGLSNDISGAFVLDKVTVGTATGLTASNFKFGGATSGDFGAADELAVESAVTGYVASEISKVELAQGTALTGIVETTNGAIAITAGSNDKEKSLAVKVDGTTVVVNGSDQLATGLKIVKTTTTTGYAASYELVDSNGTSIPGSQKIEIVKDQFLRSAEFGYATAADGTGWVAAASKTTETVPLLKLVFDVNTDGDATDAESANTVYIDVSKLVDTYTAGTGLSLSNNEFSLNVSGTSGVAVNGATISGVVKSGNDYLSVGADGFTFNDSALSSMVDDKVADGISTFETDKGLTGNNYENRVATLESGVSAGLSGVTDSGNIVISDGSNKVKTSGVAISTTAPVAASTDAQVPTSKAVYESISGFVSGSGLTADKIVFGDGGQTVKTSSIAIKTTANDAVLDPTSDAEVPTSKAIADYVNYGLATLNTQILALQAEIDGINV